MYPFPTVTPKGKSVPMTNAERQAAFRKRHPGYNAKYRRRATPRRYPQMIVETPAAPAVAAIEATAASPTD